MKSTLIKSGLLSLAALGIFSACENDDRYQDPAATCYTATPTTTVADVYALAPANSTDIGAVQYYDEDGILEAYVTSSDAGGTFYKSISFQTLDGSLAFSIPVDMYNIYTEFIPGRKVYVNLKGRHFNQTYGSLIIGDLYNDPDTPLIDQIGRLVPEEFRRTVKASCEKVDEEQLVQHLTITQALSDSNINKLIELDGVQFTESAYSGEEKTYYQENSTATIGGATNLMLMDEAGKSIIFRTSEFAKFANKRVPTGSGKVRGVLTKYRGDYQFLARTEADIDMQGDRFIAHAPLGGTNIVFSGTLNEPFTSYAANATSFPAYVNDQTVGNRYWQIKEFSGNKYIEMTSFGGSGVTAKAYIFIPVDFTAASTMTFKEKMRFMAGEVLKVYYVTSDQYTALGSFNVANFTDITASFGITYPASGASEANFNSAGTYNIPASLTGTGFFVFEHSGTPAVTTTAQIDDIVIN
ncbi:DUF5689 domain-containing protein [Flavobacterium sp.]|uniref:DUF5689 domain-containing protein n=1 Tax=Flavobacterium sp. TaxID=239 RepID=UPI0039E3C5A1